MLQEKVQAYLNKVLMTPSQFQGLGLIWSLCLINIALAILLGGVMMLLSNRIEFFLLTLAIMVTAGSMVVSLLIKLQRLKYTAQRQQTESKAYEAFNNPLLILTEDLLFSYGNKKAREDCWWAENISFLRKLLTSQDSRAALERLVDSLDQKEERMEVLHLHGRKGEEIWRIHSIPLGRKSLWQCDNVSHEKSERSKYLSQIKTLTLFLDQAVDGLFSLNEKGVILFCNDQFAKWLGFPREKIIGIPLVKFLKRPRLQDPRKATELHGKCEFMTASSRLKSAFLEQTIIPCEEGFITYSLLNIHAPIANQSDLSKILEMTPLPMICLDDQGLLQDSNILFREKFWLDDAPARGIPFLNLVVEAQRDEIKAALQAFLKGNHDGGPLEIHFNDSRESIVSAYFSALPMKNKKGYFILFHDITEQKRFETQLVQSQKMQAVGQLAGGIAHDFNNLLTAMIGFCDLLLLRHTPGDQSFTDVMQIKQNANRAANLVRQLLAFSRQQTLQPKVLDITECLAELSALLRRLIGSNIELKIKHARDLGLVLVDQGQFEQVIINMVVNARDAMESGGTISVTTQNCEFKKGKRFGHDVIPAGAYVLMQVTDTGVGVKPEILDRIFDPFFTTKEVGSGTGLGLSTVYGIVKQTGGFIHVDSKVGVGTNFSIYLPHYIPEPGEIAKSRKQEKSQPQDLTGSSTILLVEDEDAVRLFSSRALRSKGYKVLEAPNGEEALKLIKSNKERIDLVISDVVMPQMDGPTFINEISKLEKNPKVLFISGYTEDTFHNRIKEDAQIQFLPKPFSLSDLAVRVKEILGEDGESLRDAS
jgi:two-component system cell cycle sensor histidine kinase/response regulator CckA